MFYHITDKYWDKSQKPCYLYKPFGSTEYQPLSYRELQDWVIDIALGFRSLGIQKGDTVGIASENRIEWIVTDFALASLGAVDVPIFATLTADQERYIFHHCQAKVIVVSNRYQLQKLLRVRHQLHHLSKIVVFQKDAIPDDAEEQIMAFDDLRQLGRNSIPAEQRRVLIDNLIQRVQSDDLLTIIYTSGTTGVPKGVMLTHHNILSNIAAALEYIQISEDDILLSYLPLCHSYERTAGYYGAFYCGATVALAESIDTVANNILEVQPTVMTSVPRLFERIYNRVLSNIEKQSFLKKHLFSWALDKGMKKVEYEQRKESVPRWLSFQYQVADRLVFSKIKERTGGRLRFFVSGGAPLNVEVGKFFFAIGIPIYEGYGLTEASPVVSVNKIDDWELGTVGTPLPNVEVRIAEDGEILVRGPNVMKGYYNDEAATKEVIDQDGWLHTGDIGFLNEKGHLVITDRKKHIFVSSGGKNIAPQPIENALMMSPFIDQVVLIGDKRPYNIALIVPNFDALREYLKSEGIEGLSDKEIAQHPQVYKLISREVQKYQKKFAKFEQVRKIGILNEQFTVENGQLTPTLKVRRHEIERVYKDLIEKLYE